MVSGLLLVLVPASLLVATIARLTQRRTAAHVARAGALVGALYVAWLVAVDGPMLKHLYRWIEVGDLQLGVALSGTGYSAALLLLLTLWVFLAPFLCGKEEPGSAAALDLAAAGVGTVVIADSDLLSLMGCEVLLIGSFLYVIGLPVASVAARRLLFMTRLGGLSLMASLVASPVFGTTDVAPWFVLLTAGVLVGAWPFHTWFEDLGANGTATGIRLISMIAGVSLCLRVASTIPQAALAVLALSALLSVSAALATQDLFRAQIFTVAAQGGIVLAAAIVNPLSALLLSAVYGASQVIHATVLDRITSTLPDTRLPELGSLGVVLPWSRWLAVCGALGAVISLPALWAVALLADHAWSEAGPAGAVIVALLCAMPILPLARITLVPFAGSRRHDTTTAAVEPLAPRRVALAAILLVAGPLAGLTWMVSTPPLTTATAAAAGAVGLLALVGFLLWRCGPRQTNPIASPIRNFAAHGLGIAHMLGVLGAGTEAIGRLLWTALDGGLFAGVPATLNLGVRAAGWLLARLHDGWSGWAVATATGTAVILLWSMWFGGGRW